MQTLDLHLWWLPLATCAGGLFPYNTGAYSACACCNLHCVIVVVVPWCRVVVACGRDCVVVVYIIIPSRSYSAPMKATRRQHVDASTSTMAIQRQHVDNSCVGPSMSSVA